MFTAAGKLQRGRVVSDPYWSNVSLLLHADGTNGSTSILDATGKNTLTAVGNAALSTVQSKFGGSSLYFDGTGDYITSIGSEFAVGTGDFTIELWAYYVNASAPRKLFQLASTYLSTSFSTLLAGITGTNKWEIYANGAIYEAGTVSANNWYHIAYVRRSGISKLYVDGTSIVSVSDVNNYTHTYLVIGGGYSTTYLMNGYIDELRVTKGVARYTANFTPPTKAFPNQ